MGDGRMEGAVSAWGVSGPGASGGAPYLSLSRGCWLGTIELAALRCAWHYEHLYWLLEGGAAANVRCSATALLLIPVQHALPMSNSFICQDEVESSAMVRERDTGHVVLRSGFHFVLLLASMFNTPTSQALPLQS